jgi:hypothetical protein
VFLAARRRKTMRTVKHDRDAFRQPMGFIDVVVLLTLAAAIGTVIISLVIAVSSWLG